MKQATFEDLGGLNRPLYSCTIFSFSRAFISNTVQRPAPIGQQPVIFSQLGRKHFSFSSSSVHLDFQFHIVAALPQHNGYSALFKRKSQSWIVTIVQSNLFFAGLVSQNSAENLLSNFWAFNVLNKIVAKHSFVLNWRYFFILTLYQAAYLHPVYVLCSAVHRRLCSRPSVSDNLHHSLCGFSK